jgi:hypothetical protein
VLTSSPLTVASVPSPQSWLAPSTVSWSVRKTGLIPYDLSRLATSAGGTEQSKEAEE